MTTTITPTDNKSTRQLKQTINKQSTEISKLRVRLSELVDDIHIIKSDISTFKAAVSKDMKGIVATVATNKDK